MGFNANEREGGGGTPIEALEADTYPGRLVQLVLMGLQPQRPFKGTDKPPAEMMYIGYELSHEFLKDDDGNDDLSKPRWVSESFPFYNLSADLAKSTKRYTALDPTGMYNGDWIKLAEAPCQITLSKEPRKGKEGQFTNYVTHVSGPVTVPGYSQPELVNPLRIFDIDEPDMAVFEALPKWLKDKLTSNLNYQGSALQKALGGTETIAKASTPPPSAKPSASTTPPKSPKPPAPNAEEG